MPSELHVRTHQGTHRGLQQESAASKGCQDEAILRVSSYHRRDYDLAAIWTRDQGHDVTTTILSLPPHRTPSSSLGILDQLPVELINAVCLELDVASLFALRQVNLRGRQIVNALPEFKLIAKYAVNCLCAMLRTGAASGISLSSLWRLFCTSACSTCQDAFGNMLHLLTWKRYCARCLHGRNRECAVVTVAYAKKQLQLPAQALKRLPTLRTIPGIYTMEETSYKRSLRLVSQNDAFSLHHDKHRGAEPTPVKLDLQCRNVFMSCCGFPSYDTATRTLERGVSCSGCQLVLEERDGSTDDLHIRRDKVFTKASFLKHYEECKGARRLWESSDNGKMQPPELPFWCRNGGYFS